MGLDANRRPLLIAEIGVSHDGSVERAETMTAAVAAAGFDFVKFQYWIVDELLSADVPSAPYQGMVNQREMLSGLELTIDELTALHQTARRLDLGFMVTPDGRRALADVLALQPDALKIGSGDADNPWLIEDAVASGLPLVVSTGMMRVDEVLALTGRLQQADEVVILHCVSAYPTALEDANLTRIPWLQQATERPVGFSDHTLGVAAAAAALALGAVAIEKHVTWSPLADGPDHASSLALDKSAAWVAELRSLWHGLQPGRNIDGEEANRPAVRKALYAARDIVAGEPIVDADLVPLRPLLEGIPAGSRDAVIGCRTQHDVSAGRRLRWADMDAG